MVKGTINFFNENSFNLIDEELFQDWLFRLAKSEHKNIGEINYIFCDDEYLLEINQNYLDHDTYTDIISFDNTVGNSLNGDIFISTERVEENAAEYNVDFLQELKRVRNQLISKWEMNPQRWEDFPPDINGEYLMLWPGLHATRTQLLKGEIVPSSMRNVDANGYLQIESHYLHSDEE